MSTTSTEKKTLPDIYQLVWERAKAIRSDYITTFTSIFPDSEMPPALPDPLGNFRELKLSDYVDLFKENFKEHPFYAINDSDYHLRTEATATPGTINRISYNEEEDRYYGLFNHSTIMKSDDLEKWEDALRLSVDEEYAFMNAEIEFFLFNLGLTFYEEAKRRSWPNNGRDQNFGAIGALKGTRIKEFKYMNGVYLIVVENCLGILADEGRNLPEHPDATSNKNMKNAFASVVSTRRKDAYYEIVYATEVLEDPKRWHVVTSGPKAEWEGLFQRSIYSAGNDNDGLGNIADRPPVREYTDFDTDWRDTWAILMTNGDYFVSHDKFHSWTEQHVDNLAVTRNDTPISGYINNQYPRMFNAISHYQYYDVDALTIEDKNQRRIALNNKVPTWKPVNGRPINLDSNSSPLNNIWVIGGLESELMISHDLSHWSELPNMMKEIQNVKGTYHANIIQLLKMGKGCTLSKFDFGVVAIPHIRQNPNVGGSYETFSRNDECAPFTFWFNLSRIVPRADQPQGTIEIDGKLMAGNGKAPVVQRTVLSLESWENMNSARPSFTASGLVYENREMNVGGLYGIHNPNADTYRPNWDIVNQQFYAMDYIIGCGITPDVMPKKNPPVANPLGDEFKNVITKYDSAVISDSWGGKTRSDSMPLRYKVKLPGDTDFKTINRASRTDPMFDIPKQSDYKQQYGQWDSAKVCDATVCFSRSKRGCVIAYRDTIYEYTQAPDTGLMMLVNTVKIIPNAVHPDKLTTLYNYNMGDTNVDKVSRAPANDAKVKAPDLVGNSYLSAPYVVKYCPEAGMYFAWERYNPDNTANDAWVAESDPHKSGEMGQIASNPTTIRFIQSYDGIHWEKRESPEFYPTTLPYASGGGGATIVRKPFSAGSRLSAVPEAEFKFDGREWIIKDIYTFRGKDGRMNIILMLSSGWYVQIRGKDDFSPTQMYLYPLESVLWNRLYIIKQSNTLTEAARLLPEPYAYNSFLITKGADWNKLLEAHPLLSGPHNGPAANPSFSFTPSGGTAITVTSRMTDRIDLSTNTIIEDPILPTNDKLFLTTNTNLPFNSTIQFPLYQMYLTRQRRGATSINNKYILHRYNEVWREQYYGTLSPQKSVVQGALNRADNVGYDNVDTSTLWSAKGSYIGQQMYQNSSSMVRQDFAMYEQASPGWIKNNSSSQTEVEGNTVQYIANPLGHYNYNLFMLISMMNVPSTNPVPVFSYRATGFGNAFVSLATATSSYTPKLPYAREYGSHVWSFFDRGANETSTTANATAFRNAVAVPLGYYKEGSIVSNKGHYYVNFMQKTDVYNGIIQRGIRTLPSAVDLSLYPYDYRKWQFDGNMNSIAAAKDYSLRPNRILVYDGMTIYNYEDRLFYRNYGKMELSHDTLIQAYNDKMEFTSGRALQMLGVPWVEGSILQKENNKLFLTSPTGQLSLVEMERPADVDDIGTTKCIIDPDTMHVQYGTRRELETKEEWRSIYNSDLVDPYMTNQMPYHRPHPIGDTANRSLVEKTIGDTDAQNAWTGPSITSWKDFLFIVDRGNLRVLSKHWQDGFVDDFPVMVSLNTKSDGSGTKVWILKVALLDSCDTVHPFAERRTVTTSNTRQSGIAFLYLFCNTGVYGIGLNPALLGQDLIEVSDRSKPVGPLDNVLQHVFQKVVAGETPPTGIDYVIVANFMPTQSDIRAPYQVNQLNTTTLLATASYTNTSGSTTDHRIAHKFVRPSLNASNALSPIYSQTTIRPSTDTADRSRILQSGPATIRYGYPNNTTNLALNIAIGGGHLFGIWLSSTEFMKDAKAAGFILGDYAANAENMYDMIVGFGYNPDNSEIIYLVKTVGSTASANMKARNPGIMKYQIGIIEPKPVGAGYTELVYTYNTSAYPMRYLGSSFCDHINLVDINYYNHQWIALGYKAPYSNDRYGSNTDPISKQNNADLNHPKYTTTAAKPLAQNILHVAYSKDAMNWGEFYSLEIAKPIVNAKISPYDVPYLIVDNEHGNCFIYDGQGRILTKSISKKYALENQVILGEQTDVYARAVYRGYSIAINNNESPHDTIAGCDIVLDSVYPEYLFTDSFDVIHLSGQVLPETPSTDGDNIPLNRMTHIMDFHSMAIAAFDSFNFGVNDRYDTKGYQYPYEIDYNANGRSGGIYAQFYHTYVSLIGDEAESGRTGNFIPLEVIQQRSKMFYRANNPNGKFYHYPLWPNTAWSIDVASNGWNDVFPSNRYFMSVETNGSDSLYQLGLWAFPRRVDQQPYKFYQGIADKNLDTNLAVSPGSTTQVGTVGRFVDHDYTEGRYLGDHAFLRWRARSNARMEYSPMSLLQNLTTRQGFVTLYQSNKSTVMYFPSVGKVWIHLDNLGRDTFYPQNATYFGDNISNDKNMRGLHLVDGGSYTYTYFTIIGRKMETLRTFDQHININPVTASPYLERYSGR